MNCIHNHSTIMLSPSAIRIGLIAISPSLLFAQPARAENGDGFYITAGAGFQHDDNVFRTASNDPAGRSRQSDDITTSSVGLKWDKSYSLQRFQIEGNVVDYRYRSLDNLNFTAHNYSAAWRWNVTPSVHGNLSADRKESLSSFADFTGYGVRNIRTEENRHFDAVFEVTGGWRLLAGANRQKLSNSELFIEEGDTQLDTVEGGARYDFRSGSSLGYVMRTGRGEYFNRHEPLPATQLDNRFDQREHEMRLVWPITAKTTFDVRAGYLERDHAHFSDRDYSGSYGNFDVTWDVTEKTSVMAGVGREMNSYQSAYSSYAISDRFSVSPLWQITAKTALRGRYDYIRRDYRGAISDSPLIGRSDTIQAALIALEWQPLRTVLLSASLQNGRRSSNRDGFDYHNTIAGVSARLAF